MYETDRLLFDSGFELPWSDLELSETVDSPDEKAYSPGFQYDFYTDLREITSRAKHEILIMEAYPNNELIDLYLNKLDPKVKVNILIGSPLHPSKSTAQERQDFLKVAEKFSKKPGITFELRENNDAHDRLFFIDKECWISGQSIKDAATRKPTYLVKINSYESFRKVFDPLWDTGNKLI